MSSNQKFYVLFIRREQDAICGNLQKFDNATALLHKSTWGDYILASCHFMVAGGFLEDAHEMT